MTDTPTVEELQEELRQTKAKRLNVTQGIRDLSNAKAEFLDDNRAKARALTEERDALAAREGELRSDGVTLDEEQAEEQAIEPDGPVEVVG